MYKKKPHPECLVLSQLNYRNYFNKNASFSFIVYIMTATSLFFSHYFPLTNPLECSQKSNLSSIMSIATGNKFLGNNKSF